MSLSPQPQATAATRKKYTKISGLRIQIPPVREVYRNKFEYTRMPRHIAGTPRQSAQHSRTALGIRSAKGLAAVNLTRNAYAAFLTSWVRSRRLEISND